MATVKKGVLATAGEWWKHLRKFQKKLVSKKERQAAKKEISSQKEERFN